MAVQPRRGSSTRKRKRRTHFKLKAPHLVNCKNCNSARLQHMMCKECKRYKDRQVL